jgi:hypothetical protein
LLVRLAGVQEQAGELGAQGLLMRLLVQAGRRHQALRAAL